jgi:phenylacetate-CoA ligase
MDMKFRSVEATLTYWAPHLNMVAFDSVWPAVCTPHQSHLLTGLMSLSQTQWLPTEAITVMQHSQAMRLAAFAAANTSYYKKTLRQAGIDPSRFSAVDDWRHMPILTRQDVQSNAAGMSARTLPPGEHAGEWLSTSGGTGEPVKVRTSIQAQYFYRLLDLRVHEWHRRHLGGTFAAVRAQRSPESTSASWTVTTNEFVKTGPAVNLDISASVQHQAGWLEKHNPDYFLTYPSNLLGIIDIASEKGGGFSNLKQVQTTGEIVSDDLRRACHDVLGVGIVDVYSSQELGCIATQCPEHQHLHVQAESVLVEVLRSDGSHCDVGEVGRVVVTALHNHAMPLIRYETGDLAEVGPPCPCGRGLPVLTRVVGRTRHLVTFPDGRKFWPRMGFRSLRSVAPIRQFQIVQKSTTHLLARLAVTPRLDADQEFTVRDIVCRALGHPFDITFEYVDEIRRGGGGKIYNFLSEIP